MARETVVMVVSVWLLFVCYLSLNLEHYLSTLKLVAKNSPPSVAQAGAVIRDIETRPLI